MNKKILGLLICISGFSSVSFAETYESTSYINILDKKIINVDKAMEMNAVDHKGIYDLIDLGDFYVFNEKYRNTFKSFKNYNEAARQGSEYAKLMVGYMTYKGYGTTPNVFKGEYLLKNVKKPYDKNAKFLLGLLYLDNNKQKEAISLFKEIKDPVSYKILTTRLIANEDFKDAIPYLNWLIDEENSAYAKRELGSIYLGQEFHNEEKAIQLLKSAAKQGDAESQYLLGMYFYKGTSETKADIKESVRWFLMATQNNHAFATQELLKIWNDNQTNNNMYYLDNDPYLTKTLNDIFTKMHLN